MARKRFGFKPSLRATLEANNLALRFMAAAAGKEVPPGLLSKLPPKREYKPRVMEDSEAVALDEIETLLRTHKDILFCLRFNSGSAQRQLANGNFAPVKFHRWIKRPEKMKLPDIFGVLYYKHTCGIWTKPIAIEVKKSGWTGPGASNSATHIREREQAAFLAMIRSAGGIGLFATDAAQVAVALA